jgi:hypothetical protein
LEEGASLCFLPSYGFSCAVGGTVLMEWQVCFSCTGVEYFLSLDDKNWQGQVFFDSKLPEAVELHHTLSRLLPHPKASFFEEYDRRMHEAAPRSPTPSDSSFAASDRDVVNNIYPREPHELDVGVGITEVRGPLDPNLIHNIIGKNRFALKDCFKSALTRHPYLDGQDTVLLSIGPTGAVDTYGLWPGGPTDYPWMMQSSRSAILRDPLFKECISSAVRRWMFPKPQGGSVMVTQPLMFSSPNARIGLRFREGSAAASQSVDIRQTRADKLVPAK